jgi:hypothetical protein
LLAQRFLACQPASFGGKSGFGADAAALAALVPHPYDARRFLTN